VQVYFSHSYRDAIINGYFLGHFEDEDIPLHADQKTDIWCVAKLERHITRTTGFISIIPRRPTDKDAGGYSPYIAQELTLARRARVPRLLFVDEQILKFHSLDFPEDAVPFSAEKPDNQEEKHAQAISEFRTRLDTFTRRPSLSIPSTAAVIVDEGKSFRKLGEEIAEMLRRKGYTATVLAERRSGRGLDDIRLLETLWRAELCVFLLGHRLSEAYIALAMAHAHCIPAIRLLYDKNATDCTPTISGLIPWSAEAAMLIEFERQLTSYKEGLVLPLEIAQGSNPTDAMRAVGTMKWRPRKDNLWDTQDCLALLNHISPSYGFVEDEVTRARQQFGKSLAQARSREDSENISRLLYEGFQRHRFAYEFEPPCDEAGRQAIRTPSQIETHKSATCIDMSCLFAALLEAANQKPLVVTLEGRHFAHALAGYRAPAEPEWEDATIGSLRRAVTNGDAVFFEATGAIEADAPVGAETASDRAEKLLGFTQAKEAATRMLTNPETRLKYFLDVNAQRKSQEGERH